MIEIEGLTKQFGPLAAVAGIDLAVNKGEVLALNLGYCTEMLDDYARAFSEALTPMQVEPQPQPDAAPATQEPVRAA